jgi:hypothetical protein
MNERNPLHRYQFGKYLLARQNPDVERYSGPEAYLGTTSNYSLWAEPKESHQGAEHLGSMEVEHKMPYSSTLHETHFDPNTGQGAFFYHNSRIHATDEVTNISMSRAGRHMAPTMLGVAQNEAQRRTGRNLTASTDLSRHSERLVANLKQRGVVPASHTVSHRNTMNFAPVSRHGPGGLVGLLDSHFSEDELVTRSQVELGQHTVRRLLQSKQYTPVEERGPAKPGRGQGKLF